MSVGCSSSSSDKRKKRASLFLDPVGDCIQNDDIVLKDVQTESLKEYAARLENETTEWKNYKRDLRNKLKELRKPPNFDVYGVNEFNYLESLSEEDRNFMLSLKDLEGNLKEVKLKTVEFLTSVELCKKDIQYKLGMCKLFNDNCNLAFCSLEEAEYKQIRLDDWELETYEKCGDNDPQLPPILDP